MTTIQKLRLYGFKSFHKLTEIPFENNFNVIIGANGAGKSNVSDAICFVLGKSSAKSLRAEKSANLIYNGGKEGNPSKFAEVSIFFDNNKHEFPIKSDEVKVTRIVKQNGQSIYKINDEVRTRQQVVDLLSNAKIDPDGHNIILQGDIARFMEMKPVERRQLIEEIAGISVYEDKKKKALLEMEKVQQKLSEADIILTERSAHLRELKNERDQAIKYKELEKTIKENKATLINLALKEKQEFLDDINKKIEFNKNNISNLQAKVNEIKKFIDDKKTEINNINKNLEEKGEKEQLELRKSTDEIRTDLVKNTSRLEFCQNEITRVENRKKQLKINLDELEEKLKALNAKTSIIQKEKSLLETKNEKLEKQIDKFKDNFIQKDIAKEKSLANFLTKKILDLNYKGVIDSISNLGEVDDKYALALEVAAGARINSIVVEDDAIAKRCIDYLRENKLGIMTFLPLNKLKQQFIKQDTKALLNQKGIIGLAINLINFNPAYKIAFSYVFRDTIIVDNLDTARRLIGKARIVTLQGDLVEISGAMTGGHRRKSISFKKTSGADLSELEDEKQKLREKLITTESDLRNLQNQISTILTPERDRNLLILKGQDKELEEFKNEINDLKEKIKIQQNALKEKEKGEQKFYSDIKNLSSKRGKVNEEIQKKELVLIKEEEKVRNFESKVNEINLDRAKTVAELEGLQKEFEPFKEEKIRKSVNLDELKYQIQNAEKTLLSMGNVNLKALEIYEDLEKNYQQLMQKKEKLIQEKEDVISMMNEIETKKAGVFLETFNILAENYKKIFSVLATKGEAHLDLENKENPLEEESGIEIKVKIASNKFLDIRSMSGGEKTLAALAFIFAIQEYDPASFYLLDEVDAALDKTNSEKLSKLIAQYSNKAQYLVISHNDSLITEANNVYGVSMQQGISKIVSLKI